ncbi:hypothetical protein [Streptomyces endophyticus]|uniref:Uncharacterized protein n=1 Tax=Streptomyces endophyticus TaxID=714166 RepID=A0ABU6F8L4_9ACTN|nr:hypothetical protein [Streptomyces endophyticus]MEB8340293.1 hypothetical protein [Streptomyces endophyticus]
MILGVTGSAFLAAACSPSSKDAKPSGAKASPSKSASESVEGKAAAGKTPSGAPDGALGVNFNEDPAGLGAAQLQALSATWVRGFVPVTPGDLDGDVTQQRAVKALLTAHGDGRRTILSLKFPYSLGPTKGPLPAPGSAQLKDLLALVDRVLAAVIGKVDILTIGNEPFLETLNEERDNTLNVFYENLARHVIDYRKRHGGANSGTSLYMGALNNLDDPAARTPATERWLRFVHKTPELAGVDIHPHVTSLQSAAKYINYVVPTLRPDQKFLATEFSLVQFWKGHMHDPVSPTFAKRYNVDPGRKVWQVVGDAIAQPFPQEKWNDFISMTQWLDTHRNYLTAQMKAFRDTGKLAVSTYGGMQIASMASEWGADKTPWILNPLYANRTVRPGEDGTLGRSVWFDQFKALQQNT